LRCKTSAPAMTPKSSRATPPDAPGRESQRSPGGLRRGGHRGIGRSPLLRSLDVFVAGCDWVVGNRSRAEGDKRTEGIEPRRYLPEGSVGSTEAAKDVVARVGRSDRRALRRGEANRLCSTSRLSSRGRMPACKAGAEWSAGIVCEVRIFEGAL